MPNAVENYVGSKWTWLTDYGYLYAAWTLNVEDGREVQVGMGLSIGGVPRGEKITVRGHKTFRTVGIGAIHVRARDGLGECMVRLDQGDVGLIPIYKS